MKTIAALITVYVCLLASIEADPLIHPDDRLAICSDGTSDPGYSAYIEAIC